MPSEDRQRGDRGKAEGRQRGGGDRSMIYKEVRSLEDLDKELLGVRVLGH